MGVDGQVVRWTKRHPELHGRRVVARGGQLRLGRHVVHFASAQDGHTGWVQGLPPAALRGGNYGDGSAAGVFSMYLAEAASS